MFQRAMPLLFILMFWSTASAQTAVNTWQKVAEGQVGPRIGPAIFWDDGAGAFIAASGYVSHQARTAPMYDIVRFDPARAAWINEFPEAAKGRGGETGPAKDPGFKTPYFQIGDKDGVARPHPQQAMFYNQFAYAPWDQCLYVLCCGHTLRYDHKIRIWTDLKPATSPAPVAGGWKNTLAWGALCADPVNKEIVLVGGCGVPVDGATPGTWVYSTQGNNWRKLDLKTQPGGRALSPMAYDPTTKKIVLFGGDHLDQIFADTWVYDCATRVWEERKPELSPSPRFGHALLSLPKSKAIVLIGGKTYTSSTDYGAMLYKPLPFEMWSYDTGKNTWLKLASEGTPTQISNRTINAAAGPDDSMLIWTEERGAKAPDETWTCRVDPSKVDPDAAQKSGVKPGTLTFRTDSFDPDWYTKDVPAPDPQAFAGFLAQVPPNRFVDVPAPKWPVNRQGGGWSTVAYDPDTDQILHIGGGHSSYFGNDVAQFDLKTGRWSISCRPQFALDFNYDLSGPGQWAFNNAPWGNHNYKAYAYDTLTKRMVLTKGVTMFYDPRTRTWPSSEVFPTKPFLGSKYVTFLCPTPHGLYVWGKFTQYEKDSGLFRLVEGKSWEQIKTSGDALPPPVCDAGSYIVYDRKRDQFLIGSIYGKKNTDPAGEVWSCNRTTGEVKTLHPAGREKIITTRFAREAVYLTKSDLVMAGALIPSEQKNLVPFYDPEKNAWFLADLPGSEIFNANRKSPGASIDLGLAYDEARDLTYAVCCDLKPGLFRVLRFDRATANLKAVE